MIRRLLCAKTYKRLLITAKLCLLTLNSGLTRADIGRRLSTIETQFAEVVIPKPWIHSDNEQQP